MNTVLPKSKAVRRRTKSFQIRRKEEISIVNIENLISKNNKEEEDEIESLYTKKDLFELKNKILIYRIKKLRNDSALKIQNMWNKYKIRFKVHKLSHKVRGCYTIYPEIKNACKMYIKIFTNELNKEEFKILPLDFCPIRKCFVKDIPKNKFYTSKKIMYFNFIKNNKIFYDDKYEKVLYSINSNEYAQKVDFSLYDIKQKLLDDTIYNKNELFQKYKYNNSNSKDSTILSTEDEKENSENSILSPNKSKINTRFKFSFNKNETFNEIEEDDEYEGLRAIKRKSTNEPLKEIKINKSFRRFESFDIGYSCKSKLKSILKDSNCEELHKRKLLNIESGKKVSFGKTVYFY